MITVKRAYLELEREGVIRTQQGKGSQVSERPGLGAELRHRELTEHLRKAAELAALLGLEPVELETRLREAVERARKEPS